MSHTPGPWKWVSDGDKLIAAGIETPVIDSADYEGMWFANYGEHDEAANKALVAAAPTLLGLVEGMVGTFECEHGEDDPVAREARAIINWFRT